MSPRAHEELISLVSSQAMIRNVNGLLFGIARERERERGMKEPENEEKGRRGGEGSRSPSTLGRSEGSDFLNYTGRSM